MLAGPLAAVLAFAVRRWRRTRPRRLAGLAVAGAALTAGLWSLVVSVHAPLALHAALAPGGPGLGVAVRHAVWCWLALAGLGPGLAWAAAWLAPPSLRDLEARSQRRADRTTARPARPARVERAELESWVGLGVRIAGDAVLPARGRELVLPLAWLARHALVVGASGSGKTETLLQVARRSEWAVFFVDGKGDRETMRRFHALMRDAGRGCRLFPDDGYDGWRGSAEDVAARLVEVIDFAEDGPGAYYRDQAINLIRLACEAPSGAPRSAAELLQRLDLASLEGAYFSHPNLYDVMAYTARQVAEVRARYSAFFGAVRHRLDHGWAFEDADAAHLLLDGLRLKHEAARLARFLVEDFTQYAVDRKPRSRRVLLIVDEFSAIAHRSAELVLAALAPTPAPAAPTLIDAATVAERFGVDRGWVNAHADELGAIRLGGSARPRLRFDPQHVLGVLAPGIREREERPVETPEVAPSRSRRRRPSTSGGPQLLPIRGQAA